MENNATVDLKKLFGRESALDYDQGIRRRILGYDSLHEAAHSLLQSQLREQARILIAAAGTGQEAALYAQAHPGWKIVGFDPSAEMLELGRARIDALGLGGQVQLHQTTIEGVPLGPPFDAATALLVMHFLPDDGSKLALLRGLAGRLEPGATFILADMTGQPGSPDFETLFEAWKVQWQRAHGPSVDIVAMEKEFADRRSRTGWIDETRHLQLFAQAGFVGPIRIWSGLLFCAWAMRRA
jgi:tRNA (cmo5U34)-methyltransferase